MESNEQLELKKRAENGDVDALYEYGMLYLKKGDEDQAMKYLLAAANDNYPLACEEI